MLDVDACTNCLRCKRLCNKALNGAYENLSTLIDMIANRWFDTVHAILAKRHF